MDHSRRISLREKGIRAVIFDLDGVLTLTARLHRRSWERMFNGFFETLRREGRADPAPFDPDEDYERHLDGLPRYDGVQAMLDSRGIALERGTPDDPPDRRTVCGLGNRKNAIFHEMLESDGAEVYQDSADLVRRLQRAGVPAAVVSSSRNCRAVLRSAGLDDAFAAVADGLDQARLGLPGKPAPDIFLEAAGRLGVEPGHAAVVEDALSGVEAGRRGGFGLVVGVDRVGGGHADELRTHGADVVLDDMSRLRVEDSGTETEDA